MDIARKTSCMTWIRRSQRWLSSKVAYRTESSSEMENVEQFVLRMRNGKSEVEKAQVRQASKCIVDNWNEVRPEKLIFADRDAIRLCLWELFHYRFVVLDLCLLQSNEKSKRVSVIKDRCSLEMMKQICIRNHIECDIRRATNGQSSLYLLFPMNLIESYRRQNSEEIDIKRRPTSIPCKLTVMNNHALFNSNLIRDYVAVDNRIGMLIMTLKVWVNVLRTADKSLKGISSYEVELMLIHYLLCGFKQPLVPDLMQQFPKRYSYDLTPMEYHCQPTLRPIFSPKRGDIAEKSLQLGGYELFELLIGFFHYWSNYLDHSACHVLINQLISAPYSSNKSRQRNHLDATHSPPPEKNLYYQSVFWTKDTLIDLRDPFTMENQFQLLNQIDSVLIQRMVDASIFQTTPKSLIEMLLLGRAAADKPSLFRGGVKDKKADEKQQPISSSSSSSSSSALSNEAHDVQIGNQSLNPRQSSMINNTTGFVGTGLRKPNQKNYQYSWEDVGGPPPIESRTIDAAAADFKVENQSSSSGDYYKPTESSFSPEETKLASDIIENDDMLASSAEKRKNVGAIGDLVVLKQTDGIVFSPPYNNFPASESLDLKNVSATKVGWRIDGGRLQAPPVNISLSQTFGVLEPAESVSINVIRTALDCSGNAGTARFNSEHPPTIFMTLMCRKMTASGVGKNSLRNEKVENFETKKVVSITFINSSDVVDKNKISDDKSSGDGSKKDLKGLLKDLKMDGDDIEIDKEMSDNNDEGTNRKEFDRVARGSGIDDIEKTTCLLTNRIESEPIVIDANLDSDWNVNLDSDLIDSEPIDTNLNSDWIAVTAEPKLSSAVVDKADENSNWEKFGWDTAGILSTDDSAVESKRETLLSQKKDDNSNVVDSDGHAKFNFEPEQIVFSPTEELAFFNKNRCRARLSIRNKSETIPIAWSVTLPSFGLTAFPMSGQLFPGQLAQIKFIRIKNDKDGDNEDNNINIGQKKQQNLSLSLTSSLFHGGLKEHRSPRLKNKVKIEYAPFDCHQFGGNDSAESIIDTSENIFVRVLKVTVIREYAIIMKEAVMNRRKKEVTSGQKFTVDSLFES